MAKDSKKIFLDDSLLDSRQIFLYDAIYDETVEAVIKKMAYLDQESHDPITLWIDSCGGVVSDGFSLIDYMEIIKSPIWTIISGEVCSMAGIISVSGDKRYATRRARWMAHPMSTGGSDYWFMLNDRVKENDRLVNELFKVLSNKTKLNKTDLKKWERGELWLSGNELLKKGIIDRFCRRASK